MTKTLFTVPDVAVTLGTVRAPAASDPVVTESTFSVVDPADVNATFAVVNAVANKEPVLALE